VEIWYTTPNTRLVVPTGSAPPAENREPRFAIIDSVVRISTQSGSMQ
jgi:hypothetical protein